MASYTRKSSFTRTNLLAMLGVDPVFSALSSTQQNNLIDAAVQKVGSLHNLLGHEDFKFDTTNQVDLLSLTYGFSKYLHIIAISAGTTYNGTLYEADTVIVNRTYGVSTLSPDPPEISAGVLHVITSSEFTTAVQVIPNQFNILYSTVNPDDMEFDVGSGWGVYSILIYEV